MPCPAGTFSSLQADHVLCMPGLPTWLLLQEAGLQAPVGSAQQVREAVKTSGTGRGEEARSESQGGQLSGHLGPCAGDPCQGPRKHLRGVLRAHGSWPGYYCDSSAGLFRTSACTLVLKAITAPGIRSHTAQLHPVGTYISRKGLRSITECQLCLLGFCALEGLTGSIRCVLGGRETMGSGGRSGGLRPG